MRIPFLNRREYTSSPPAPTKRLPFGIQQGDSIGILGMRHTGKTEIGKGLYKAVMDAYPFATGYIIDSNASGDFTGWRGGYSGLDCPIIRPGPRGRQVVWQPPRDDADAYEDFFQRLYAARVPAVLFIDELVALGKGGKTKRLHYSTILKRGRARPNFPGITIISLSQEFAQSADVPRQTFSQCVHFIRFYVQNNYDLREANRLAHLAPNAQPEHQHGFWHIRLDKPPLVPKYYKGKEVLGL